MNFGYKRAAVVALDFDAFIDSGQDSGRKAHIDNRAMDSSDPT